MNVISDMLAIDFL